MPSIEADQPPKPVAAKEKPNYRITIYDAWCKRCGICAEFCPKGVLTTDQLGTPEPTNQDRCIGCAQCVLHCPDFAVSVSIEKRNGEKAEG